MTEELYKRHRPSKLSELVGQDATVNVVKRFGRDGLPHCILLTGPSGCGKTSLARILQRMLRCSDTDFHELNCAGDARGIDAVREIRQRMGLAPLGGECRIWLLDEAGKLTPDAQTALLKMLEDTPSHVFFFLATTDPQKLIATIKTRATELKLAKVKPADMAGLVRRVATAEGSKVGDDVVDRIVEVADGSPRKALVLLNQAHRLPTEEEQLAAVSAGESSSQAIELARALIKSGVQWGTVAALLKGLDDEPESLRRMVLGYCASVLLSGGKVADRAARIVDVFRDNFYDCGKAGLVSACWEVVKG